MKTNYTGGPVDLGIEAHSQRGLLLFSVCFFSLAAAALYLFLSENPYTNLLLLLLFALSVLPFVIGYARGSFDLFEIIYPVAFFYFLEFGARTIYLLNVSPERAVDFFFVPESLDRALLYVAAGFGLMLLGYYSKIPGAIAGRLPLIDYRPDGGRVMKAIIGLYIIGMISRSFFFTIGRTIDTDTPAGNLVDYLYVFCQWSLILAIIHYYGDKRGAGPSFFLWFVFLPAEVFFAFLRPGRHGFLPILVAPYMAYHYLKKRVSTGYIIVPALIMIFVLTPLLPPIKALTFQGYSPKFGTFAEDLDRLYTEVVVSFEGITVSDYLSTVFDSVMNRVHGIDSLTTVIAYTPEAIDYQYGKTIFAVVGFLVPKVIRENSFLSVLDTDVHSLGRRLGGIYYGSTEDIAGVSITQPGELYLNFGVYGILVGMFLLGIFYRTFYLYYRRSPHPFSLLVYMVPWFLIIIPEFWFVHAYSNFTKQLLLLLAVCWYLNGGRLFRESR